MAWLSQVGVDTSVTCDSGWCLWLAEECVGAPHWFPNARSAWDNNTQQHADRNYPTDAVVALFWSWTSKSDGVDYGHVVINVPGQGLFSSPKNWGQHGNAWYGSIDEVSNWLGATYLGWTSELAGLQLAVWQDDAPLAPNQRRAAPNGAFRRAEPNQQSEHLQPDLEGGEVGNFVGYVHGEDRGGNDIWFQGISGNYFWSGAFEDQGTHDLPDLNAVSAPVDPAPVEPTPVEPTPEPVTPEPTTEPTPVEPVTPVIPEEKPVPELTQDEKNKMMAAQASLVAKIDPVDLGNIISNPVTRKIVWAIYGLTGLVIIGVMGGLVAAQWVAPEWFIFATGAYTAISPAFASLAMANISTNK